MIIARAGVLVFILGSARLPVLFTLQLLPG